MSRAIKDELASHFVLMVCEGEAEEFVVLKLLEGDLLAVPREHLVCDPMTGKPLTRLRRARDIEQRFMNQDYTLDDNHELLVARILDRAGERFDLRRAYRSTVMVRDFVTHPEIEMLAIHKLGAISDWRKARDRQRGLKPSEFCRVNLGIANVKHKAFLETFWETPEDLAQTIRDCQPELRKTTRDELDLTDLLMA